MPQPTYQPAALLAPKNSTWRFIWYNLNPHTNLLERVRPTLNINRIRDTAERRRVAKLYLDNINEALKHGYNYFVDTLGYGPVQTETAIQDLARGAQPQLTIPAGAMQVQPVTPMQPEISILKALESALKIRLVGMKKRTCTTYTSFVTRLSEWLQECELHQLPVQQFTADTFQEYLFYKHEQGHGNRNLNDHTNFFKTTFDVIRKKLKLITTNPLADFEFLPEEDSTLFEPLTVDELQRVAQALREYNPRFYLYTRFIAFAMIRPYHIGMLRASQIGYNTNTISVAGHSTKNKKNSVKQLLKPLKGMLVKMNYHTLPGHYYLFGNNFEPSPVIDGRLSVTAAEIWKEIVIDGLGINKKMYALKHTASQYFVNENENADLKFLQQQMEHGSMAQTEIYLQGKVTKRVDEQKIKFLQY